jgi:hypothetical protein
MIKETAPLVRPGERTGVRAFSGFDREKGGMAGVNLKA